MCTQHPPDKLHILATTSMPSSEGWYGCRQRERLQQGSQAKQAKVPGVIGGHLLLEVSSSHVSELDLLQGLSMPLRCLSGLLAPGFPLPL